MNIRIVNTMSRDGMYEEVRVLKDGVVIAGLSTSMESTEDNTLGRMDVIGDIIDIIRSVSEDVDIDVPPLEIED